MNFAASKIVFILLCVLIGLKLLMVSWSSFIKPVVDPDIIRCYALGAKIIFLSKMIFVINPPWIDKPLMPFLSQAWTAIGMNRWNDALLTLPNPALFLSFLVIFYSALSRHFRRWYSLLATFLLATIPFLVFHAGTAYADFPQAFYYSTGTFYLFLFMKNFGSNKEDSSSCLLISSLLLGLSVWAKKSGLYYSMINGFALLSFLFLNRKKIEKGDWKTFAQAAVIFIMIAAPWLAFNRFYAAKGYYAENAFIPALPAQLPPQSLLILIAFFRNAFFEDNWHLLGTLFVATLVLFPRKAFSGPRVYLLLIVILQLTVLFATFRFTGLYQFIFQDTSLNRLALHFIPVILFFCAETIGEGEKELTGR